MLAPLRLKKFGRPGEGDASAEPSEIGGHGARTGGVSSAAGRSQGLKIELQSACYCASNPLHGEATANELGHLDVSHRGRCEVLPALEGLREAANFVVSFRTFLSQELSISPRLGPGTATHRK